LIVGFVVLLAALDIGSRSGGQCYVATWNLRKLKRETDHSDEATQPSKAKIKRLGESPWKDSLTQMTFKPRDYSGPA
jgi:hypothetical protein